jgi:hypothetical protein
MEKSARKILLLLVSVQFIFTLDTTFMNVSISDTNPITILAAAISKIWPSIT